MKSVVLENDDVLTSNMHHYIDSVKFDRTLIFRANEQPSFLLIDAFKDNEILEFQPTLITFSQYNLLLMCIYSLIVQKELGLKEIHFYAYDKERLEEELKELWHDKRRYLDVVLSNVKLYRVSYNESKQLLNI